ncbi:MAG: DUF429 domain-containing protein [Spirulinaceae cyanobacterium SM2_1_0]|nr:DUF429 domain-containing protein [Spirulinaceae cyanobacterium SM2_1_0]
MKFCGVDLGWVSAPSGLCSLLWRDGQLHCLELARCDRLETTLAWLQAAIPANEPGLIAVDAPTLIPNETGMRQPDRLAHQHFGRYHAGCYPANRGRPFAARTVGFGLQLEARGFRHAPEIVPQQPGRYQIEVFPHAAIVQLFQLDRILKYKKGRLAARRAELQRLQRLLAEQLPQCQPAVTWGLTLPADLRCDLTTCNGAALKAVEDRLDSLVCAYVAAYWWYWGVARNLVLGDRAQGYIIVPYRQDRQ